MSADDLRAIPEACDAAGNCVGWVPVPVAARDAIVALIDAARALDHDLGDLAFMGEIRSALAALDADA